MCRFENGARIGHGNKPPSVFGEFLKGESEAKEQETLMVNLLLRLPCDLVFSRGTLVHQLLNLSTSHNALPRHEAFAFRKHRMAPLRVRH